jgi:predicted Zn-dependent protease
MSRELEFGDEGYRWRESEVESLPPAQARALLLNDAREEAEHHELEVAYQILRELVWRFPESNERWQLLAIVARRLGHLYEAKAAAARSA